MAESRHGPSITAPSAIWLAIVADDLTGAMDAAAPFAQRGMRTRMIATSEAIESWPEPFYDVLSVTTESRHLRAEQAAHRVRAAVDDVLRCRPRLLFKKVDSTLRGNVATEIAAALHASGRRHAVIAPAVPAQGRVMCGGEVYVDGVLLRDTAIARDPISPPPQIPLAEALWRVDPGLTVHDVALDEHLSLCNDGAPHAYVADCVSREDLDRIVRSSLTQEDAVLLVGASGLAEALAGYACGDAGAEPRAIVGTGLILVTVGSRSPQSNAQVDCMRADAATLVLAAPAGKLDVDKAVSTVSSCGRTLGTLVIHAESVGSLAHDAAEVARSLGALTAALLVRLDIGALVVTGGDTAQAILAAIGARAIDVVGELMPGIALGTVPCAGRRLPVVTKAGGFGDEQVFADISRLLRRD